MLIRFCFLLLLVRVSWTIVQCRPLCLGCNSCYVGYRLRIKYFRRRCLYYANTTSSYCESSCSLATSGDIEKNPGPLGSIDDHLSSSSRGNCRKRPATTPGATHRPSKRGVLAADCSPFDIGIYAFPRAKPLSNEQKYDFVQKCWNPDALFSFPKTAEGKNMSQRSFRHEWLRIYPWLRISGCIYPAVPDV